MFRKIALFSRFYLTMQEGIDLRDPISELFVTFYFGVTSQLHKELNHITSWRKEVKTSF